MTSRTARQPLQRITKRKVKRPRRTLSLYLFNVGQGDHLLLEMPNGKFGIIDFHYDDLRNSNLEPPALTYLRQKHKNPSPVVISFICLSHPDRDHTKGIKKTLKWIREEEIKVERLWLYDGIDEPDINAALPRPYRAVRLSEDRKDLFDYLNEREGRKERRPEFLRGPAHLDSLIGKGKVEVCVIAPTGPKLKTVDRKTMARLFAWNPKTTKQPPRRVGNLVSSVIKMRFANHQLLFGGDTNTRIWQESLDEFDLKFGGGKLPCHPSYKANFIKISHHGARNSSSSKLWERILCSGSQIGISAGRVEGWEHPHRETIAEILQISRKIGQTPARLLSTNVCNRCVRRKDLPIEKLQWLPFAPSCPRKKHAREALAGDAPRITLGSGNPHVDKALNTVQPRGRKPRSRQPQIIAAYVYRFHSDSEAVNVTKAIMPAPIIEECIYYYHPNEHFPECANANFKQKGSSTKALK